MEISQLNSSVVHLLADAGVSAGSVEVQPVDGGGNNRAFSVYTPEARYLAKFYFSNPSDRRDRLGAEFSFLSYAKKIGMDCVPRPIYCSPERNMGLYEFVEGRKLSSSELTERHIMQAAGFIRALNAHPDRDQTLPTASEGCFSIEQHFSIVDRRLQRLQAMPVDSDVDRAAHSFVDGLWNVWVAHKNNIAAQAVSLTAELDVADRCISPSDFGFHNALLRETGDICFIDFEYAGWDDPAKMVNDFFLQPGVSVPFEYFNLFAAEALRYSRNVDDIMMRSKILFPVFQMKWCCILLNEFLPDAALRRSFSMPEEDVEARKSQQLDKARFCLGRILC